MAEIDRLDVMMALLDHRPSPLDPIVIRLGDMPSPRQAWINLERSMVASAAEGYRAARARKIATETPAKAKRRAKRKAQSAARKRGRKP